jgi:threonine/homoserine/homoserine lactone efflux protein
MRGCHLASAINQLYRYCIRQCRYSVEAFGPRMDTAQLWAFVVFSMVGSFTPGPNTTIATATGANFGFRAVVPHIAGVPFGFSTLLVLGSLGVAGLLLALPAAASAIKWLGALYMLYLGWLLLRPAPWGDARVARPLSFWQSAMFQYVNPKAWMLAAATASAYAPGANVPTRTALICAVWSVTCMLSLVAWAWLGAALGEWLGVGTRLRGFNALMGFSLMATAVWIAATS